MNDNIYSFTIHKLSNLISIHYNKLHINVSKQLNFRLLLKMIIFLNVKFLNSLF